MKTIDIDRTRLLPHDKAFNCSIIRHEGKTLMAYRIEEHLDDRWAKIAICELDDDWQPIPETNRMLDIMRPHAHTNLLEDPRFFTCAGELRLSFIAALLGPHGHVACQGVARLDKALKVFACQYLNIGDNFNYAANGSPNFASEKNWTFWEDRVIYRIDPLAVYKYDANLGEIQGLHLVSQSRGSIHWPHGNISGSTPLVPYGEYLIGMFHSFIHDQGGRRNYSTGWYVINPKTWRLISISREPVIIAKDGPDDLRPQTQTWKPNVVFPCGLMESNGEFVVSYGWQDSRCRLAFFTPEEVAASLVPVTEHFVQKEVLNDPYVTIPGGFDCEIGGRKLHARSWPKLLIQASAMGIPVQDLHDALVPRVSKEERRSTWAKE